MTMALKKYAVIYMAGGYEFKDTWYAESSSEAWKFAQDDYSVNLDDFQRILSVEEI